MPTPLENAQAMLTAYLEAEAAILQGKETRIGGSGLDRFLKLEDLDKVRQGRAEWERKVRALTQGGPRFAGLGFAVADARNPGDW